MVTLSVIARSLSGEAISFCHFEPAVFRQVRNLLIKITV